MKKILLVIGIFTLICGANSVNAAGISYSCLYEEDNTYYSFDYTPGETAEQECKFYKEHEFFKDEYPKCIKDHARKVKAYKAGACKKILPPKVYNNVEGCTCKVQYIEGNKEPYSKECSGEGKCNANKAMKKLEWMLAE